MVPRTILALLVMLSVGRVHAQEKPCDNAPLLRTSKNFSTLYDRDIRRFLQTFNSKCKAETFIDWRNELLFDIVDKYPNNFVRIMDGTRSLNTAAILKNLQAPVSEDVDLEKLIKSIEEIKGNRPIADQIVEQLRLAKERVKS